MKVVCEGCQAKYQVPDERVAGKKLRIRCKRCGESVLIRGDLLASAHATHATQDEGATVLSPQHDPGVEWFASVDGDVSGPFNVGELGRFLGDNAAGWDAYVWREGASDWVPAHESAEVIAAVGGGRTVVASAREDDQPTRMFDAPSGDELTQAREPSVEIRTGTGAARASVPSASTPSARPHMMQMPGSTGALAQYSASAAPQVPAIAARSNPAPSFAAEARMPSPSAPPQARPASSVRPRNASLPPSTSSSGPDSLLSRAASIPPTSMHGAPAPAPRAPSLPPGVRAPSIPPAAMRSASLPPGSRAPSIPPAAMRSASLPPGAVRAPSLPPSSVRTGGQQPARGDESMMLSSENLRHVAASHSQPPMAARSVRPGTASGDGSGIVDIRALASIAQQQAASHPQVPMLMQPSGSYVRVDSIAPATARRGNTALPIAIVAGCALIAAAAFAAIVITRTPAAPPALAAAPVAVAAVQPVAQPISIQAALPAQNAAPAAPEPTAAAVAAPAPVEEAKGPAAEDTADAEESKPEVTEAVAVEKRAPKRHGRAARSVSESKKDAAPEEEGKAKDKDKDKAAPPSLDDVMLAEKSAPAEEAPEPEPAAPEKETSSDIDDLLAGKSIKAPEKSRSFDELLDGAVVKKSAPAAEVLPDSPTREQTLTAMRGIESDVRGCDGTGELAGSTVQVKIQVSGSTGRVTSSDVEGAEGPVAACIAKAARAAEFPRFGKPSFAVKFPYRFK